MTEITPFFAAKIKAIAKQMKQAREASARMKEIKRAPAEEESSLLEPSEETETV